MSKLLYVGIKIGINFQFFSLRLFDVYSTRRHFTTYFHISEETRGALHKPSVVVTRVKFFRPVSTEITRLYFLSAKWKTREGAEENEKSQSKLKAQVISASLFGNFFTFPIHRKVFEKFSFNSGAKKFYSVKVLLFVYGMTSDEIRVLAFRRRGLSIGSRYEL